MRRTALGALRSIPLVLAACALLPGCGKTGKTGEGGGASEPTAVAVEREADRGDGPPSSAAEAEKTSKQDDLRIAVIEKAVNDTKEARHKCWEFAAVDDFRLQGTVVLRFTFPEPAGPSEGVTAAIEVVSDAPGDPRLTACLEELYGAYLWPAVFESGQAIELPFSFRAPRAQYTVAAKYVEAKTLAGDKLTVSVLLDEQNSGNGAGAVSTLIIKDGMDVPLHRHSSAELLYVKSGGGVVYGLDGVKRGVKVGPGHGIYIPAGTAHGFVQRGKEPTSLVQLYTPAGPEKRFKGGPTVGTSPVSAQEIKRHPRRFPRPLVTKKPKVYSHRGGTTEVAFYFDESITGDKAAYMGILTARPGTVVPPHRHPRESEYLLILEGGGTMKVAGSSYPVAPMTAIQIPANTEHSFATESKDAVVALQFYTPAGPEQRFKQAPAKK